MNLNWLRNYYRNNKDYAFGVGKLKFNLWIPETGDEKMKDLIAKLIDEIGPGHMGSTAYDTAWAARLGEIDWNLSSPCLGLACRKSAA